MGESLIFVTVGTEQYPFNRLCAAVDDWLCAAERKDIDVVYQTGSSTYRPRRGMVESFMPFRDIRAHVERASVVVAHAGVGTVDLCVSVNKKPVIFPRRRMYGEAIDDHQVEYARHVERYGYVYCAETECVLSHCLQQALETTPSSMGIHSGEETQKLVQFLGSILV